MFLLICLNANLECPSSPAVQEQKCCDAVMLGILADYGLHPTFGQWIKIGA